MNFFALTVEEGAKTIIHLAAINGTKNFYNNPDKFLDILLTGGYSILKFAHKKKIDNNDK